MMNHIKNSTFIATSVITKPVHQIHLRDIKESNMRDSEFSANSALMGLKTKRILKSILIIFITANDFLVTSVTTRPETKAN